MESETITSSLFQILLFAGLGACIFAALACQFIALRHKSKNWLQFVHKDSMYKHKQLAYTETGMKYIQAQKYLAIAAFGFGFALALTFS